MDNMNFSECTKRRAKDPCKINRTQIWILCRLILLQLTKCERSDTLSMIISALRNVHRTSMFFSIVIFLELGNNLWLRVSNPWSGWYIFSSVMSHMLSLPFSVQWSVLRTRTVLYYSVCRGRSIVGGTLIHLSEVNGAW